MPISTNVQEFQNDGDVFQLETRLNATQEAIKRTRLALFFCLIGSLSSLVCLWNTVLSVDRLDSFRLTEPAIRENYTDTDNTFTPTAKLRQKELTKDLIQNWMESTYIDNSLLGLKVSVSDFSFYNSTAMLLLVLYLLLSERRENREVGRLFQSVVKDEFKAGNPRYLPNTVYRSVMSYMVFNLSQTADEAIWSIWGDIPKIKPRNRRERWFMDRVFLLHKSVSAIFLMPWISILLNTSYHIFIIKYSKFPWDGIALSFLYIPVMMWEIFTLIFVGYLTVKLRRFHQHTRHLADKFKDYATLVAAGLPLPERDLTPPPTTWYGRLFSKILMIGADEERDRPKPRLPHRRPFHNRKRPPKEGGPDPN